MSIWKNIASRLRLPPAPGAMSSFRLPLLVLSALVLACAVGWAFFMGYMVGRGQNPEAGLQAITGLAPAPAAEAEPPSAPAVIPDLAQPEPREAPAPVEPPQFSRPEGGELAAWAQMTQEKRPEPPARSAPQPAPVKSVRQAPANSPIFDYSYQVAAFKSNQDAQGLAKRLAGAGLRPNVQKSGKVYLVLASLRGSADDAAQLRKKLLSLKVGKPLLLSKKEAPARGKRKK